MEQREATTGLYDADFALWVKAQVAALREGRLSAVDVDNVTEELEALAKRDRREIKNRLRVLGAHLLKRRYQPDKATSSWDATVTEQSARIIGVLEDSPSLVRELPDFFVGVYAGAVTLANAETVLFLPVLPDDQFVYEWCAAIGQGSSSVFFETRLRFKQRRADAGQPEGETYPPTYPPPPEDEPEA